jgi:hypothetical protein
MDGSMWRSERKRPRIRWKYKVRNDVQMEVPNIVWHNLAIDRAKWHEYI